ncbi:hypothetical protein ABZS66_28215 [Dactylosporangium sp. NPDC005572]|uniref:hypothetical protein n=1 Tax=Dactylosporangium sp. NPDC005572 TaxID=3156889 RepID=UPI0033B21D7D
MTATAWSSAAPDGPDSQDGSVRLAQRVGDRTEPADAWDPAEKAAPAEPERLKTSEPRQFPGWLDRHGPPDLVAEAERRWPWAVVLHAGDTSSERRLVVGNGVLADVLNVSVGHPIDTAEQYADAWEFAARRLRPSRGGWLVAAALARAAPRRGTLIVDLNAIAAEVAVAARVRPKTLRGHLNLLVDDGMLGRFGVQRRAVSSDWGRYALTVPLPPLAMAAASPR